LQIEITNALHEKAGLSPGFFAVSLQILAAIGSSLQD
jgi:hypothetical protein